MSGKFKFWDADSRQYIFTDEVLRLSASDINQARQCEMKVYNKLTQPKKEKMASPLLVGSVFHEVIELNFKYKINHGSDMQLNVLNDTFNQIWNKMKSKGDFTNNQEIEAKSKAFRYVQVYWEKRCGMLIPKDKKSIEFFGNFAIVQEGKRLKVAYKIDMLDKSNMIIDHKTSSQPWTQEIADKNIQAYIYPIALRANGIPAKQVQFNVVCKDSVDAFVVQEDQNETQKIFQEAFKLKKSLEEGNMLSNFNKCKYCEWQDVCSECEDDI